METAIAEQEHQQVATTPAHLLELAVSKDLDIEKLTKLVELQNQWNAEQNRKAFFQALANFQSICPDIRKTKQVSFETRNGGPTEYFFAPLGDIDRQIRDPLEKCGLTKRWETHDDKDIIKVTCIITHVDGHSERTSMTATPDNSGGKNAIQARGSAITYMKRYTLIDALGISTADMDIDGRLPEADIDKLHGQYMELYNEIVLLDENFRTPGNPDNWAGERTPDLYVKAIGKARQVLTKLKMKSK